MREVFPNFQIVIMCFRVLFKYDIMKSCEEILGDRAMVICYLFIYLFKLIM